MLAFNAHGISCTSYHCHMDNDRCGPPSALLRFGWHVCAVPWPHRISTGTLIRSQSAAFFSSARYKSHTIPPLDEGLRFSQWDRSLCHASSIGSWLQWTITPVAGAERRLMVKLCASPSFSQRRLASSIPSDSFFVVSSSPERTGKGEPSVYGSGFSSILL